MGYENGPGGSVEIGLSEGTIRIIRRPPAAPWVLQSESLIKQMVKIKSGYPRYVKPGWTVTRHTNPFRFWPGQSGMYRTMQTTYNNTDTNQTYNASAVELTIPIWMPFVLAAALTALLFWRDRRFRFPPGHCRQCGYNLKELTEARCPECGQPFEPKGNAP